jgi:hypothetical protein
MAVTSTCARARPRTHLHARARAHAVWEERSSLWLRPLAPNPADPLAAPPWPLPRGLP